MAPLPNVQLSYGPMLLGVYFNMILYGVFLSQLLTYHHLFCPPRPRSDDNLNPAIRRPNGAPQQPASPDGPLMQSFIAYLLVLETANTALDMALLYQPLILEYGEQPLKFPVVFVMQPMLVVLVSTPIQLFFAWRIWKITKHIWCPVLIVLLAGAALAGGLCTSARVSIIKLFARKPELHTGALVWFLASSAADVLITAALVLTLSHRKTGFATTDSVIDRIIRTTIQTGLATALFSILDVVCFEIFPHDSINFIFDLPLSKLYSNALLSTLNARPRLAAAGSSTSYGGASRSVAYPADDDADGWGSGSGARDSDEEASSSRASPASVGGWRGRCRWLLGHAAGGSTSASASRSSARKRESRRRAESGGRRGQGRGTGTTHQLVFEDMRALGFGRSEIDLDGEGEGSTATAMTEVRDGGKEGEGVGENEKVETDRASSAGQPEPEIVETPRIPGRVIPPDAP